MLSNELTLLQTQQEQLGYQSQKLITTNEENTPMTDFHISFTPWREVLKVAAEKEEIR